MLGFSAGADAGEVGLQLQDVLVDVVHGFPVESQLLDLLRLGVLEGLEGADLSIQLFVEGLYPLENLLLLGFPQSDFGDDGDLPFVEFVYFDFEGGQILLQFLDVAIRTLEVDLIGAQPNTFRLLVEVLQLFKFPLVVGDADQQLAHVLVQFARLS